MNERTESLVRADSLDRQTYLKQNLVILSTYRILVISLTVMQIIMEILRAAGSNHRHSSIADHVYVLLGTGSISLDDDRRCAYITLKCSRC